MTTLINTDSSQAASFSGKAASFSPNMICGKTIWGNSIKTVLVAVPARTMHHLALKWDLYAVVTLIVSCTGYGAFALAHIA